MKLKNQFTEILIKKRRNAISKVKNEKIKRKRYFFKLKLRNIARLNCNDL